MRTIFTRITEFLIVFTVALLVSSIDSIVDIALASIGL